MLELRDPLSTLSIRGSAANGGREQYRKQQLANKQSGLGGAAWVSHPHRAASATRRHARDTLAHPSPQLCGQPGISSTNLAQEVEDSIQQISLLLDEPLAGAPSPAVRIPTVLPHTPHSSLPSTPRTPRVIPHSPRFSPRFSPSVSHRPAPSLPAGVPGNQGRGIHLDLHPALLGASPQCDPNGKVARAVREMDRISVAVSDSTSWSLSSQSSLCEISSSSLSSHRLRSRSPISATRGGKGGEEGLRAGVGMALRGGTGVGDEWADGLVVDDVVEGGGAWKAGVERGDVLMFVSMRATTCQTSPSEVASAIAEAGSTFHILVERRGEVIAVTINRPSDGDAAYIRAEKGAIGCELSRAQRSPPVVVSRVIADSPAGWGGLKVGDLVVAVGSVCVSGMTKRALTLSLRGPEGTCCVAGFSRPHKPCGTRWARMERSSSVSPFSSASSHPSTSVPRSPVSPFDVQPLERHPAPIKVATHEANNSPRAHGEAQGNGSRNPVPVLDLTLLHHDEKSQREKWEGKGEASRQKHRPEEDSPETAGSQNTADRNCSCKAEGNKQVVAKEVQSAIVYQASSPPLPGSAMSASRPGSSYQHHHQQTQTPPLEENPRPSERKDVIPPIVPIGMDRMPRIIVERMAVAYLKQHDESRHLAEERRRQLERDVDCVSKQSAGISRGRALHALRLSGMDVVEAVMGVREGLY